MIKRWMIKIQIYIANFNLGVRKISGRHTWTLSGLTPPLSVVAARHRLVTSQLRRPEMSAPVVVKMRGMQARLVPRATKTRPA
jgi:hypothetical protein